MTITSDEKDRALLLARLPSPTYAEDDEGELLAVCSRCWGATAEAGSEWCASCILGGEDEDVYPA